MTTLVISLPDPPSLKGFVQAAQTRINRIIDAVFKIFFIRPPVRTVCIKI